VTRPTINGFYVDGQRRELQEPDGPPTKRQLLWLAKRGYIEIVDEPVRPLTKGECASAIDRVRDEHA